MRGVPVLVLLLAFALPAVAAPPASTHARTVEAPVAYPTPLGPVTALDDGHVWEVVVPNGASVHVDAEARAGSLFHLRAKAPGSSADPSLPSAPTLRDGVTLHSPGTWRVSVDPAVGAAVHVEVLFRGFFGGIGGAPAPFEVRDVEGPNPCVVPGACLP